jgi:hypothetical protein
MLEGLFVLLGDFAQAGSCSCSQWDSREFVSVVNRQNVGNRDSGQALETTHYRQIVRYY